MVVVLMMVVMIVMVMMDDGDVLDDDFGDIVVDVDGCCVGDYVGCVCQLGGCVVFVGGGDDGCDGIDDCDVSGDDG